MKMHRWVISLLLACLFPFQALAGGILSGESIIDNYETAMDHYYLEDYKTASHLFLEAGNYKDAKKWAYYCQAIDLVLSGKNDTNSLEGAQARFELLAGQSFQQAEQWAQYCKARSYEIYDSPRDAMNLYSKIVIHDSIERYLACQNKSHLLESADSIRKRMRSPGLMAHELYDTAMNHYYLEAYSLAADYFCLAGNYRDARQWRCYCQAIDSIISGSSPSDISPLFALLSEQGFSDANQWLTYCKAREYEELHYTNDAIKMYKTIFLYDSSERYLKLIEK